jgi:hypothetical protein
MNQNSSDEEKIAQFVIRIYVLMLLYMNNVSSVVWEYLNLQKFPKCKQKKE